MHTNGGNVGTFIDITDEVCPLTFVKTKLRLEKLASGDILEVRLRSGEPLINVPKTASEQGHVIISIDPEAGAELGETEIYRVRIQRK